MQFVSNSYAETINLGSSIARHLKPKDIVCLFGQLGAGKTVLVKGIAAGLGLNRQGVVSPSFVLMRLYQRGKFPLYHFDLYRLKSPEEINAAGFQEYLYGEGIAVIEWADRLKYLTPKEFLKMELIIKGKNSRLFKFSGFGKRYKELTKAFDETLSH